MIKNLIFSLVALFMVVSACEVYEQDEYEEYYVVESYLVANRDLAQVRLSTTAPAFDFYSFANTAVSGADVEVRLLAADGTTIEQTIPFSQASPGIYLPDSVHSVLPLRTYQLHILIPSEMHEITARTLVPDAFNVIAGVQDTVTYQSTANRLELTLSESNYPGRQNVFIFNTIASDTTFDNLTPVYRDLWDGPESIQDYSNTSSGLINEGNFTVNSDGTVTIRYPWIAVAFYGDNRLVASTLDDNIYDYIRSESVQLGGSSLSPGEIQNVITHVEGGIGLFGSVASDSINTFIKRPPFEL